MDKVWGPCLLGLLLMSLGCAQSGDIVPLGSFIGTILDADENRFYQVFPDTNGFESAQFYEQEDKGIVIARIVWITRRGDERLTRENFTLREFIALKNRLIANGPMTVEDRRRLYHNVELEQTRDVVSSIPAERFVRVSTKSNREWHGTFMNMTENTITIQTEVEPVTIPITDIKHVDYRTQIRKRIPWKPWIYFGSGIGFLALSELWNIQTRPEIEMVWYYRFLGTVTGLMVAGEVEEAVNILQTPMKSYTVNPNRN